MNRSLGCFAVVALVAASGCATAGRPEPRFAGHHAESRGDAVAGLVGSVADLVTAIAEIKADADDADADARIEWVREEPDEAMPLSWPDIPHQPPRVTAADPQHAPFDAPSAREAIAAADVSSCVARGAPAGYVHARVTFERDGQVTAVGFDGAEMKSEATACLDDRLKSATVPPFDGPPTTVGASLFLR